MIRFATIGTNFITEWFLEAAGRCDAVEYLGAYSRSAEKARRFADAHGAPLAFDDLEKLAAHPDIDAVYIASPNCFHHPQAARILRHGKHVLCEKPIAANCPELAELIGMAKERRVVLMEAMRSVHTHGFAVLQDNLHRLGTIRRATFQYCKYSSRYDNYKKGIIENAFDPRYANGALMDIGVYCVHPLVKLFGMPLSLHADALILPNGIDGAGTILAKYPEMQAELLYSKITESALPSQIQGENGSLLIEEIPNPHKLTLVHRDGTAEVLLDGPRERDLLSELNDWAACIQNGEIMHPDLACSEMELRILDEARKQQDIHFPSDEGRIV